MAAECNHTRPIRFAAELASLAGDAVFQLCGAGLESHARLINPGLARVSRWHHADGRESLTVALAGLCFAIAREVNRETLSDCVTDWRQVVAVLQVMSVRKGSQLGSLKDVRQLRQ